MIQPNEIQGAPCVKAAPCTKLDRKKLELLAEIVGNEFGVPGELLLGRSKLQDVCFARFSLIWMCVSKVGRLQTADLMDWHYKSVCHAIGRCRDLCVYERGYAQHHENAIQEAINAGLR